MSRYEPLAAYLEDAAREGSSAVELTFDEIAGLVGALPATAYQRRQWWANDVGGTHVQARAWLGAGWAVASVDLVARNVSFTRAGVM